METWPQDAASDSEMFTAEEILPYLSEEEKRVAREEALAQLNEEFARSGSMELLVPRLLRSCESEAKELRQAMSALASTQITDTLRASAIVKDNTAQVDNLRELFVKKNALMQDVIDESPAYTQLRQVSVLRDNVQAVIDWSGALKEVRYGNLYEDARARHFITVYGRLRRLQRIRDTVIAKAGPNYATYETFFEPYFTKLDAVLAVFIGEVLSVLSNDFIALAIEKALTEVTDDDVKEEDRTHTGAEHNNNNQHTATHMPGAGEPSSLDDAMRPTPGENPAFALLRECASVCREEMQHPILASRFADAESGTLTLTPATVTSAISTGVARAWREQIMSDSYTFPAQGETKSSHSFLLSTTASSLLLPASLPDSQSGHDVMSELAHMRRVEALLEALEYSLMPWTSPTFSFFVVALQATHEQVLRVLRSYLIPKTAARIPAREMMATSGFVQWYKKMLSSYGYARHVDLTVLDAHAAACVTTAVSGLSAHLMQLCRACAITALAQATSSDTSSGVPLFASPGGWPYTTGPADVLTVLQQSLEGISGATIEPGVLRQVGVACVDALLAYLDECRHRMDLDVWEEKAQALTEGRANQASSPRRSSHANNNTNRGNNSNHSEEYEAVWQQRRALFLYALCNDCILLENHVETVKLPFLICWDDESTLQPPPPPSRAHTTATATTNSYADRSSGGGSSKPSHATDVAEGTPAAPTDPSIEQPTIDTAASYHSSSSSSASSPFTRVEDAIIDSVYFYLDEIVLHVERVVAGQWARVFRTPAWYDIINPDGDNPTRLIIDTEIEYIQEEFATMLQKPSWRSKITRQVMVRFVEAYLAGLLEFLGDTIRNPRKHPVLGGGWNAFIDALARDNALFVHAWQPVLTTSYAGRAAAHASPPSHARRSALLDRAHAALALMQSLLTVRKPADLDTLLQHELLHDFGDCASFVVRFALLAREAELGKEMAERMLAMWQERIAYQHRDAADRPTAGWNAPPSLLGTVDRTIAELEKKPIRFFGKSARKRREEQQQRKATEEKEARRVARQARYEADVAAAARKRLPMLSSVREGGGEVGGERGTTHTGMHRRLSDGGVVEVATLADVLR